MPDDPQNPQGNDNGDVQQFGTPTDNFSQSGTGTPSSVDPNLQHTIDALGDQSTVLLGNMQKLVQLLTSAKNPVADLSKEFDKWKTQLKFAVEATSSTEEALKEVLAINKKFAQTGLMGMNKKSYNEIKMYLKELADAQKKMENQKGFLSKQGQQDLQRAIDHTDRAMKKLEDSMKGVSDANMEIDPDVLLEVARNARMATDETSKLAGNLGRGGKISRGIQDIAKIMGSNIFEKFAKAGGVSKELGKWRSQVKAEGLKEAKDRQKAFAQRYNIRKPNGELEDRFSELSAFQRSKAGRGAGPMSGARGMDGLFDKIAERVAGGAEKGGIRGFLGRQALTTLEAGGGSAAEGIGMRGLMGVAGAGEGAMGAIGAAAVPLAILEALRRVVDAVGEDNREIMQKFGQGGVFTAEGGGTAQDRLQAMRANLSPTFMSSLAVRREDNMKIIQAIEDLGVSLPELAREQETKSNGIIQGGAKGFGGVQELAYRQGRILGLDTGTTARENIKYIMQYRQSQESVNKLFDQFIKDTKASGITTTKYLSIIDDITGQFDRMGKSLQAVTGIMSVLGRTGTQTGDDLKESLSLLMGPAQRGLEQTAFIVSQMSQGQRNMMNSGQAATVGAARINAQGALKGIQLDDVSLNTIDDVRLAIQRLNADERKDAKGNNIRDTVQGKETKGALEQLLREMQFQEHTKRFAAGQENVVDFAAAQQMFGTGNSRMTTNLVAVMSSLQKSGASLNDLLNGRVKNQALLNQIQGVYGNSPDWQRQIQDTLSSIAGATVKAAKEKPEELSDSDVTDIYKTAAADPVLKGRLQDASTPQEMRDAINQLAKNTETAPQLAKDLETNSSLLMKLVTGNSSIVKAVQDSTAANNPSAENIATVTRTTGDAIEDAIARGFVKIAELLTWIADFLQQHFGTSEERSKAYRGLQWAGSIALPGLVPMPWMTDQLSNAMKQGQPGGEPTGAQKLNGTAVDALHAMTPEFDAKPTTVVNQTINNTEHTQTTLGDSAATNNSGETKVNK